MGAFQVVTAGPGRRLLAGLLAAAIAAVAVGVVQPGEATAAVTGSGEPRFTKTAGNNSYWWQWQAVPSSAYFLCFSTYQNGVQVEGNNHTQGPGSPNCTNSLASWSGAGTAPSGTYGAQPFAAGTVLTNGATYAMCITGAYWFGAIYRSDLASSNACPQTTVDRDTPGIAVSVDGTAQYTNDPTLELSIAYSDATSPPWPANYGCVKVGSPCTGADPFPYVPPCSQQPQPGGPGVWNFGCTLDASGQPDGPVYFCAATADSAVPDNPAGPNQFAYPNGSPVTSDTANISGAACGHVTLDRTPPVVTAGASDSTVKVGTLVRFSAAATDATSGVTGGYAWTFGDNTAGATGATPTHTYTQPGTFVARVATSDGAGNPGAGTRTITVQPAGGGTSGGAGTGAGGGAGGSAGGAVTTTVAGLTSQAPTRAEIARQAGGGGTQATRVGGLGVVAPKRFRLRAGAQRLPVALTPDGPGTVRLALVRSGRIMATASARLPRAGTFGLRMRLPRGMAAGGLALTVAFTPAGESRAVTKRIPVRFVREAARRARATDRPSRPRVAGGPAYDPLTPGGGLRGGSGTVWRP